MPEHSREEKLLAAVRELVRKEPPEPDEELDAMTVDELKKLVRELLADDDKLEPPTIEDLLGSGD